MSIRKIVILVLFSGLAFGFKQSNGPLQQLSLNFTSKILENKKYITVQGDVFFKKQGGVLTTHLIKPFENVTIINADGEMKMYDFQENTLMISSSALTSSESSYFWYFLNGNYNDLGLPKTGFVIKGTQVSDGMLITTWVPKAESANPIQKIELVHEKNLPVYLEFVGPKSKVLGKIFFDGYQKVGNLQLPFKITEIAYKSKSDSTLITKVYSNPKINTEVDAKYLDFKIPANAKVVSSKKK
ncbi:MAG: hypothetical protein QM534_05645 [Sediminibacterium sp.]|nr:hypothetical protein [Sediminibacterium sp.]